MERQQAPEIDQGSRNVPLFVFLHISSSWVKIRLHTENELPMLSGSSRSAAQQQHGVSWGGVGWWGGGQPII